MDYTKNSASNQDFEFRTLNTSLCCTEGKFECPYIYEQTLNTSDRVQYRNSAMKFKVVNCCQQVRVSSEFMDEIKVVV